MASLDDDRRLDCVDAVLVDLGPDDEVDGELRALRAALSMPTATVTVVLSRVQLFKAAEGLPPELAASRATSRNDSFCQFVVRNEATLKVDDAAAERWLPRAFIDRYGVRSYLGAPLRYRGAVVGSVSVMGTAPRAFSDDDARRVEAAAERVSARLEALRARAELPERSPAANRQELALVEVATLARLAMAGVDDAEFERGARMLSEIEDSSYRYASAVATLRGGARRLRGGEE
ncbi:MAG: GAF domain-containing protein [Polyangiales bacterium]